MIQHNSLIRIHNGALSLFNCHVVCLHILATCCHVTFITHTGEEKRATPGGRLHLYRAPQHFPLWGYLNADDADKTASDIITMCFLYMKSISKKTRVLHTLDQMTWVACLSFILKFGHTVNSSSLIIINTTNIDILRLWMYVDETRGHYCSI